MVDWLCIRQPHRILRSPIAVDQYSFIRRLKRPCNIVIQNGHLCDHLLHIRTNTELIVCKVGNWYLQLTNVKHHAHMYCGKLPSSPVMLKIGYCFCFDLFFAVDAVLWMKRILCHSLRENPYRISMVHIWMWVTLGCNAVWNKTDFSIKPHDCSAIALV